MIFIVYPTGHQCSNYNN